MTNLTKYIKKSFSMLIIWSLFSITFAANTSQQWRDILNQLRADWRSDKEIKNKMEDLWLDTSGYFPESNNSTNNSKTQEWWDIIN